MSMLLENFTTKKINRSITEQKTFWSIGRGVTDAYYNMTFSKICLVNQFASGGSFLLTKCPTTTSLDNIQ